MGRITRSLAQQPTHTSTQHTKPVADTLSKIKQENRAAAVADNGLRRITRAMSAMEMDSKQAIPPLEKLVEPKSIARLVPKSSTQDDSNHVVTPVHKEMLLKNDTASKKSKTTPMTSHRQLDVCTAGLDGPACSCGPCLQDTNCSWHYPRNESRLARYESKRNSNDKRMESLLDSDPTSPHYNSSTKLAEVFVLCRENTKLLNQILVLKRKGLVARYAARAKQARIDINRGIESSSLECNLCGEEHGLGRTTDIGFYYCKRRQEAQLLKEALDAKEFLTGRRRACEQQGMDPKDRQMMEEKFRTRDHVAKEDAKLVQLRRELLRLQAVGVALEATRARRQARRAMQDERFAKEAALEKAAATTTTPMGPSDIDKTSVRTAGNVPATPADTEMTDVAPAQIKGKAPAFFFGALPIR